MISFQLANNLVADIHNVFLPTISCASACVPKSTSTKKQSQTFTKLMMCIGGGR